MTPSRIKDSLTPKELRIQALELPYFSSQYFEGNIPKFYDPKALLYSLYPKNSFGLPKQNFNQTNPSTTLTT